MLIFVLIRPPPPPWPKSEDVPVVDNIIYPKSEDVLMKKNKPISGIIFVYRSIIILFSFEKQHL